MTDALEPGQVIELNDGRIATIRFVGRTSFAGGDWVGVEFEDASGKNDGSVQGQRYFDCTSGHGMFLRPSGIGRVLDESTPKAISSAANPSATKLQSTTITNKILQSRPGSTDSMAARRQTLNASSPTPGTRAVPGSSGHRTPARLSSALSTRSNASSRGATPPMNGRIAQTKAPTSTRSALSTSSDRRKTTVAPTSTNRSARPSVAPAASSTKKPSAQTTVRKTEPRISLAARAAMPRNAVVNGTPKSQPRAAQDSPASSMQDDASVASIEEDVAGTEATRSESSPNDQNEQSRQPKTNGHPVAPITATQQAKPVVRAATSSRQIEDLETRLKMMEKQRNDDKDKLKALERLQAERDRFENIIQKLQTKYQPQQQELAGLKRKVQDLEKKLAEFDSKDGEHESLLEMAALDREMAEETAEALRVELEAMKQKVEELELEVEVLREENQEFGREMSPEEKTSQGWIQMERSNERLKEALLLLRDMTQSKEAELKDQISGLEEDLKDLDSIRIQFQQAQENLLQSENAVEDLRQQLEAALGAEDMVEELTERNMALNEQIEEFKLNIEDLENLKELNDELELNHVEAEKQLQEELDYKDGVLGEHVRRATQQDEKLADYEYTITKFRELVSNLQSHLDDMRASQQITEAEAEGLGQRSKAMMDLNMKLQTSVAKTQINTVDLELRRLEAQEAIEHLAIVQLFLPDTFHAERDSVMSLLRFKRIAFKSRLLHGFMRDQISAVTSHLQEEVFVICNIMDKLIWISTTCERFVSNIRSCTLEQFSRYEGALYDLDPVERGLNSYIEGWKRVTLKEQQVSEELQRSMSLLTHLSSVHIRDGLESYADEVLMRTTLMQSQLENTALILTVTRSFVESSVLAHLDNDEEHDLDDFARQSDTLIAQSRSSKVAIGKVHTALEELKGHSMTLVPDTKPYFETAQDAVSDLTLFANRVGESLQKSLQEESGGTLNSVSPGMILSLLRRTSQEAFPQTHDTSPFPSLAIKLRTAGDHIQQLASLAADLSKTAEFEQAPPPWVLRSQELKSKKLTAADMEAELARLQEEMRQKVNTIRLRDQTLDEQGVKISLLESRMRDATAKAARITELEKGLDKSKNREKEILGALDKHAREVTEMRLERDHWKQMVDERLPVETDDTAAKSSGPAVTVSSREIDDLRREIKGLQGAVSYLRDDNRRIRLAEPLLAPQNAWLEVPLVRKPSASQERTSSLLREGSAAFGALLELVANAGVVDLAALPENKLAWRPMREKTAWKVSRQKEDWASWTGWRDEILRRGTEMVKLKM